MSSQAESTFAPSQPDTQRASPTEPCSSTDQGQSPMTASEKSHRELSGEPTVYARPSHMFIHDHVVLCPVPSMDNLTKGSAPTSCEVSYSPVGRYRFKRRLASKPIKVGIETEIDVSKFVRDTARVSNRFCDLCLLDKVLGQGTVVQDGFDVYTVDPRVEYSTHDALARIEGDDGPHFARVPKRMEDDNPGSITSFAKSFSSQEWSGEELGPTSSVTLLPHHRYPRRVKKSHGSPETESDDNGALSEVSSENKLSSDVGGTEDPSLAEASACDPLEATLAMRSEFTA